MVDEKKNWEETLVTADKTFSMKEKRNNFWNICILDTYYTYLNAVYYKLNDRKKSMEKAFKIIEIIIFKDLM